MHTIQVQINQLVIEHTKGNSWIEDLHDHHNSHYQKGITY